MFNSFAAIDVPARHAHRRSSCKQTQDRDQPPTCSLQFTCINKSLPYIIIEHKEEKVLFTFTWRHNRSA